jgi:hypothetical protein
MDFKISSYDYSYNFLEIIWGKHKYGIKHFSPYFKDKLEFFIKKKYWKNVSNLMKKFQLIRMDIENISNSV